MTVCHSFRVIMLLAFSACACLNQAFAKVVLPSVITDNMVLQQKTNTGLWGKAAKGSSVVITTSWNNKTYTVNTDAAGDWKVKVATPSFGGPYNISISDGEMMQLKNVMIGEVWVCSGQSNMEMPLAGWGRIDNYEQEIANANYPAIRLLQLEHVTSNQPLTDAKVANDGWKPCTPEYVANFSSVAYFFARKIYQETKIPVGLIHTSWGGTIAEAWISAPTLKSTEDFAAATTAIENTMAEEKQAAYAQKLKDWQQRFFSSDAGYSNNQPAWAANNAGADWKIMTLPSLWETGALPNFDGVVWYKKKIMVPAAMANKEATLLLSTIDDDDITWINGKKVGETTGYNKERKYTVPAGILQQGENEITVRIFDGSGGGGMYGEPAKMVLKDEGGHSIPLSGNWQYNVGVDMKNIGPSPVQASGPNRPTVLYNAMIHPLINYTIRGAIWYQGESNAGRAYQYRWLFPTLIKDWRKNWSQGDFPFYFVQLANFMKPYTGPEESAWAELREAQAKTLALPNTGMAVITDIGNADDIHPKNKQDVGARLALIALAKTYGKKVLYSGPVYESMTTQGNKVSLNFSNVGGGLKAKESSMLSGFEVAGNDHKFYKATATIAGNKVIVSSLEVPDPVAVRYNWANNPNGNLYNTSGLPAGPFRTDDWPGVTAKNK